MRPIPLTALELIKHCEGFRAAPYRCPAGIATIGYGSTRYENGRAVTLHDPAINTLKASNMLHCNTQQCARAVQQLLPIPLHDNQFAALISFTYNLGSARLHASTLRRKLLRGDALGAAAEFDKWVFAGGRKLNGLVLRRRLEKRLFTSTITNEALTLFD